MDGWLTAGAGRGAGDGFGPGGGVRYYRGTGGTTGNYSRGRVNNWGTGGNQSRKGRMDDRVPLAAKHFPKGPVLEELTSADLVGPASTVQGEEGGTEKKITKEDYELLASYNWLPKEVGGQVAAIVVPGKFVYFFVTSEYIDCFIMWAECDLTPPCRPCGTLGPTQAPSTAILRLWDLLH